LARVDRDGNHYQDIPSLDSARAADWNSAGIVYQSDAGLQITGAEPDAENRLVIFDYLKPFYDDPDWQPDGGRMAYMGREASHHEIFTVNPDGSGVTALTRPATALVDEIPANVAPAWSPDGQQLVFLSNRSDDGEAGAWRLWVMDADGGNQRPLPIDIEITYTYGGEQVVSWGPNNQ
jgi:dipeptidyl aminopeptidase/acylaminoacyl peptidase